MLEYHVHDKHAAQLAVRHAQVVVRYKGTHKGKVFDETKGKSSFTFRLGALLQYTQFDVLFTV